MYMLAMETYWVGEAEQPDGELWQDSLVPMWVLLGYPKMAHSE
jgi:hypothetical protein